MIRVAVRASSGPFGGVSNTPADRKMSVYWIFLLICIHENYLDAVGKNRDALTVKIIGAAYRTNLRSRPNFLRL